MTVTDFRQWLLDRRVCKRGLKYSACMSSGDFWRDCRRADWLCWVLDWTNEPHPPITRLHQRFHWHLFLSGLYEKRNKKARKLQSMDEMFSEFKQWDLLHRMDHDGVKIFSNLDWIEAENRVRAFFPEDPLKDKRYEAFQTVSEYKPEAVSPLDYLDTDENP